MDNTEDDTDDDHGQKLHAEVVRRLVRTQGRFGEQLRTLPDPYDFGDLSPFATSAAVYFMDGTSDAISFIDAGTPAVEFGPEGAGHHGPEEWVSISSLSRYRNALVEFVHLIAARETTGHLRIA